MPYCTTNTWEILDHRSLLQNIFLISAKLNFHGTLVCSTICYVFLYNNEDLSLLHIFLVAILVWLWFLKIPQVLSYNVIKYVHKVFVDTAQNYTSINSLKSPIINMSKTYCDIQYCPFGLNLKFHKNTYLDQSNTFNVIIWVCQLKIS